MDGLYEVRRALCASVMRFVTTHFLADETTAHHDDDCELAYDNLDESVFEYVIVNERLLERIVVHVEHQ